MNLPSRWRGRTLIPTVPVRRAFMHACTRTHRSKVQSFRHCHCACVRASGVPPDTCVSKCGRVFTQPAPPPVEAGLTGMHAAVSSWDALCVCVRSKASTGDLIEPETLGVGWCVLCACVSTFTHCTSVRAAAPRNTSKMKTTTMATDHARAPHSQSCRAAAFRGGQTERDRTQSENPVNVE